MLRPSERCRGGLPRLLDVTDAETFDIGGGAASSIHYNNMEGLSRSIVDSSGFCKTTRKQKLLWQRLRRRSEGYINSVKSLPSAWCGQRFKIQWNCGRTFCTCWVSTIEPPQRLMHGASSMAFSVDMALHVFPSYPLTLGIGQETRMRASGNRNFSLEHTPYV